MRRSIFLSILLLLKFNSNVQSSSAQSAARVNFNQAQYDYTYPIYGILGVNPGDAIQPPVIHNYPLSRLIDSLAVHFVKWSDTVTAGPVMTEYRAEQAIGSIESDIATKQAFSDTATWDATISDLNTAISAIPTPVNPDWNSGSGLSQILNKPTFATVATSGSYNDLTSKPTIPAQYNPTQGTGISITGSYPNQTITNTAPDQTVSLTAGTGIGVSGTYPSFTISNTVASPTFNNAPGRSLNSSYQVSNTKNAQVSYTVALTTALALLNLNGAATVFLEISQNNSTWTTINSAGISRTLSVAISLGINETLNVNLQGQVPAGWWVRLRSATSGTGSTAAFTSGQEVTY